MTADPSPRQPIRVVVVDDQHLVRSGLVLLLGAAPDIEVVADAADGAEAIDAAVVHRPDVVLMDLNMPRLGGMDACRRLCGPASPAPGVRVVIVTTFADPALVLDAIDAGASGFINKDAGPVLLAEAVRAAMHGEALISPDLTRSLLAGNSNRRPPEPPLEPLTDRELEVARAVASGASNAEIAALLHMSLGTVKTHLGAVQQKLGAANRVHVARWVILSGLD